MNFTQDWFTHNIVNFERCLAIIPERKRFLEIGAYEGRSTCWLIDHMDNYGTIYSIDSYKNMEDVEQRFTDNTREAVKGTSIISCLIKNTSYKALARLATQEQEFDFIYIDGGHAPETVLSDACMAWGMLKPSGVMLFDDYQYPHEPTKRGIDSFLNGFIGQYEPVLQNYQLAVQKK